MTGSEEVVEGIVALAIGGFLFIVIGNALADSSASAPVIDLPFLGVIYLLGAVVLAAVAVYAAVVSILQ